MDKQLGHFIYNGPDGEIKITTITLENRPGSKFGDEKLVYKGLLTYLKSNIIWTAPDDVV